MNPLIGFQGDTGAPATPSRSQPFHGKSFSLAVRMNTEEFKPLCESNPTFSMPLE